MQGRRCQAVARLGARFPQQRDARELLSHLQMRIARPHRFRSHSGARMADFHFIESFYNPSRRHSALGYLSPIECERKHHELTCPAQAANGARKRVNSTPYPLATYRQHCYGPYMRLSYLLAKVLTAILAVGSHGVVAPALSQEPVRVLGEVRAERLNDRVVKVSGRLLVGLHVGREGTGSFRRDELRAVLSGKGSFCLQISSRDGRYGGLVEFRQTGSGPIDAGLDFVSQFRDDLIRFSAREVATRIVHSPVCDDAATGPILPVLRGERVPLLTALVNPGDATVFARLAEQDGTLLGSSRVRCSRVPEGVRTAFSHACELPIPQGWKNGPAKLLLTVDEIGGTPRTEPISIWLPSL